MSNQYAQSQEVLNRDIGEFRIGSTFPDFPLLRVPDSSMVSVYEQIPDGGLLVYFSSQCESCEQTISAIVTAASRVKQSKRVILVSPDSWIHLEAWRTSNHIALPVFKDVTDRVKSGYESIVIPALALIDPHMEVIKNNTGSWDVDDYEGLLK